MLLLFDVDGTLVRVGGAGRRSLERAFEEVLGVAGALEGVRLDGATDLRIIREAFTAKVGRPPAGPDEVARLVDVYLQILEAELAVAGDRYQVMPGAERLSRAAVASGRCAVGLATGNVERGARLKLAPAGLNEHFAFGGYGSDAELRAELVLRGVERGLAHASARLGRSFSRAETFVLGDTELDVAAARAVGAVAVGVLVGCARPDALVASAPDLLVDTLDDPRLWAALGLEPDLGRQG